MENGHSFSSKRCDRKLYQIIRENALLHELTKKVYSHQRYKNIRYYLKHRIPIKYRQFFRTISQNLE